MRKKSVLCFILLTLILFSLNSSLSYASDVNISFYNIGNEEDDVIFYEGIKIVFVFLPNCPNCHLEIAELKAVEQNYNITIFALSAEYNSSNEPLLSFKSENNISEEWVMGYATNETIISYKIRIVPFLIILDDLNFIVAMFEGFTYSTTISKKVELAINHDVENYISNPLQDNSELLKVLFIIIGTGVSVLVLIFLVKPGIEILVFKIQEKKHKGKKETS